MPLLQEPFGSSHLAVTLSKFFLDTYGEEVYKQYLVCYML
jgi:hypothetical protein